LPSPITLNLRQFEIPFSIDTTGVRPIEVQLHVSRDQGQRWELFSSQPATGKNFLFTAQQDGLYWFTTRTVDGRGKADSSTPIHPQLIVNIDTANPVAEIKAEISPEGKILVSLACTDQSPSIDSLRIDYCIDQSRQWNALNGVSGRSDPVEQNRIYATADFTPQEPWQQISIRALIGDAAGNKTIVTTTVDKPRVATTDFRLATAKAPSIGAIVENPIAQPPANEILANANQAAEIPPVEPRAPSTSGRVKAEHQRQVVMPTAEPPATSTTPSTAVDDSTRVAQLPAATSPPMYAAPPAAAPPVYNPPPTYPSITTQTPLQLNGPNQPVDGSASPGWAVPQFAVSSGVAPATTPQAGAPDLSAPLPPGEPPVPEPASPAPAPRPKTAAAAMRPIGESDPVMANDQQSASRVSPDTTVPENIAINTSIGEPIGDGLATSGVQIRHCNSRKFSLEYEIESAGLAGVSDVELWGTRDRGLTWKRWGSDPDRESPFDIETNNDGAYGFRIVVVASNGLATPRPIENDLPDIFVVVDTETPSIRITGASYGEGNQTGALVMRYQCSDLNLTQRPITLSFGPSLSGPWSTIAAGLENEGAYVWPADPNLPRQIYIRIDGLDLAGNLGTYILDTPIDIQGLAPRARIRGFNPVTGTAGGSRTIAGNQTEATGSTPTQTATQPQARFK
jgi:hypothetical protein